METLGAASAVLGILDVSLKVTSNILNYAKDVKSAKKDIKTLITAAKDLERSLKAAEAEVLDPKLLAGREPLVSKQQFLECHNNLVQLEDKLKTKLDSKRTQYFWPFVSDKFSGDIKAIRNYDQLIGREILMQLSLLSRRNEQHNDCMAWVEKQKWFSPPDPLQEHGNIQPKRHEKTGCWFLEGDEFTTWLSSTSTSPALLWIHGIPGSGKSVLACGIIDTLSAHCKQNDNERLGMAFFYFDFQNLEKQKGSGMIRSLIWQLATSSSDAREVFETQLSVHWVRKSQPTDSELLACLHEILKTFTKTFLILDALDECEGEDQPRLLKAIKEIVGWEISLRILITSRRNWNIKKAIGQLHVEKNFIVLEGIHITNDIRTYIRSELQSDGDTDRWEGGAELVEEMLVKKSEGMFRWVELQLTMLSNTILEEDYNRERLQKVLDSLPEGLPSTYERILGSVREGQHEKVMRLLQWLSYSERPLTVREAAQATIIDVTNSDKANITGPERPLEVLYLCPELANTFVTTKNLANGKEISDENEIRLAHSSVKDYLLSSNISKNLPRWHIQKYQSHAFIALVCLLYMKAIDATTGLAQYPLAMYSAQYWPRHAQIGLSDGSLEPELVQEVKKLLDSREKLLTWVKLFDPDHEKPRVDAVMDDIASPLYYASLCGLSHHIGLFIDRGDKIDVRGGRFKTPLAAACRRGFLPAARLLLKNGADFRGEAEHDTVMAEAAISGNVDVVQLFLDEEKKAAENRIPGFSWPTSHFYEADMACYYGRKDVMDLLLVKNEGTDINQQGGAGSLVARATSTGQISVIEWLLELGVGIDVEGGHYGTALRAAAINGQEREARLLLDRGADPHRHGKARGSPLLAAIDFNRTSIFDLILQSGRFNVDNDEGRDGRPIQYAAYKGNVYFVRQLLEKGADVNAEGGIFGTALQAAEKQNHEEVVQLLLEYGARFV